MSVGQHMQDMRSVHSIYDLTLATAAEGSGSCLSDTVALFDSSSRATTKKALRGSSCRRAYMLDFKVLVGGVGDGPLGGAMVGMLRPPRSRCVCQLRAAGARLGLWAQFVVGAGERARSARERASGTQGHAGGVVLWRRVRAWAGAPAAQGHAVGFWVAREGTRACGQADVNGAVGLDQKHGAEQLLESMPAQSRSVASRRGLRSFPVGARAGTREGFVAVVEGVGASARGSPGGSAAGAERRSLQKSDLGCCGSAIPRACESSPGRLPALLPAQRRCSQTSVRCCAFPVKP